MSKKLLETLEARIKQSVKDPNKRSDTVEHSFVHSRVSQQSQVKEEEVKEEVITDFDNFYVQLKDAIIEELRKTKLEKHREEYEFSILHLFLYDFLDVYFTKINETLRKDKSLIEELVVKYELPENLKISLSGESQDDGLDYFMDITIVACWKKNT
jgi:hypothetical protein